MTTIPADEALSGLSDLPSVPDRAAYEAALQHLREASRSYYADGDSAMDDTSYDRLRLAVLAWEEANPADVAPDSPTGLVADGAA
ncbi:NAD-dependent DNA ligase LigA, partial [Streptomyces sp. NPDC057674]